MCEQATGAISSEYFTARPLTLPQANDLWFACSNDAAFAFPSSGKFIKCSNGN